MKVMHLLMRMRLFATALIVSLSIATAHAAVPTYGFIIVHSYPHDPGAFTEGLLYHGGFLYESVGLYGHSSIRKVSLESGRVLQQRDLPSEYFSEGLTAWKGALYSITWKEHQGFVFDLATFKLRRKFSYLGEGWGLTHDEHELIMSDGTPILRMLDPESLRELRRIEVTDEGRPVERINELEWVGHEIFANIWKKDLIARIDPVSGKIVGWIDLSGLRKSLGAGHGEAEKGLSLVLNGIAYDPIGDRLFVTGKHWPLLFEIKLVPR